MNSGESFEPRGYKIKIDLISPLFGYSQIQRKAIFLCNAADITIFTCAHKRQEVFWLHHLAPFFKHGDGSSINEGLGINQHSIHIENCSAYFLIFIHVWYSPRSDERRVGSEYETQEY